MQGGMFKRTCKLTGAQKRREYIGEIPLRYMEGAIKVTVDRALGRIYLFDPEGFESFITVGFLEHGWDKVCKLVTGYFGVPKHRLVANGLPEYFERRPPEPKPPPKFRRLGR